jgi:Domain of unknown function (DUF4166)
MPLYEDLLKEQFALLHPILQKFFGDQGIRRAHGSLEVVRARGCLRNFAAFLLGIPPAARYDLSLEVSPTSKGERWARRFDNFRLDTLQCSHRGLLREFSGPASLGFQLLVRDGGLFFRCRRAWILGLPWPLWLAPRIEAENKPETSGGCWVCVRFRVPGLGEVAKYRGTLTEIDRDIG